jgi:NADH:ubiquinone oxidoreductase subunit 4 (subunit M)
MVLLLITLPLGLLCICLAWMAWSKNRRTAVVLLLIAAGILGSALAVVVLVYVCIWNSAPH